MPVWFDIIVGSIMFISIVMAFFRGFVKEFFTVISWILATVLTIYLSPVVQTLFEIEEGKKAFYDAVSVLIIFSVSMIFFSFLFGKIIRHLKKNDCMFLDKSLGVLFGVIRGGLFVCLGYIFIVGLVYDGKPDWIQGKSVKLVEISSKQLVKLNPKNIEIDLDKMMSKVKPDSDIKDKKKEKSSKKEKLDKTIAKGISLKVHDKMNEMLNSDEEGYSDETREQVEKLISDGVL